MVRGVMAARRLRGQAEFILRLGGNVYRHAAGELGDGFVADKAGFGNDDLIPGSHQGPDGHVDGFTAAHRDQDLFRFVLQVHAAVQIPADLRPQLLQARVGGIFGPALFQAADARIPDAPGSLEVGFAHPQRDAVRHIRRQIEKLADAGRPHLLGRRRKQLVVIHHSTVHSLSSASSL